MGVSIPLSSAYNKSIKQSSELQVQAITASSEWQQKQLVNNKKVLDDNLIWTGKSLATLETQIALQEELLGDIKKAFTYGEIGYTEVVIAQENLYQSKIKKLDFVKAYLMNVNNSIHLIN